MGRPSLLAPGRPPFDVVDVMDGTIARSYEHDAFMALALPVRIRLILSGQPKFRRDGKPVPRNEALSLAS